MFRYLQWLQANRTMKWNATAATFFAALIGKQARRGKPSEKTLTRSAHGRADKDVVAGGGCRNFLEVFDPCAAYTDSDRLAERLS